MLYIQWTLGSSNNKSDSRETGNKQENYSLLPKESFWQVVQGDVLFMAEDRTIPKLRRWTWESMESKVLRVTERNIGEEKTAHRILEICRGSLQYSAENEKLMHVRKSDEARKRNI